MMAGSDHGPRVAAPSNWQDWQRWVEDVDWSDWRSWLQRVASTDWTSGPWPATPWEQAAPPEVPQGEVSLTLRAFEEDEPGEEIGAHLAATWPAFRRWWLDGANTRPTAEQAGARLGEHMPELVPTWQRLTALLGDDPEAAAALTLWNPPPFLTGCSQAAVLPGGPALVRNYDWDFRLFDAVVARTAYAGRRVLGMLDCLWGLLDGVNDAGLAVSLTFGGRPQVGEGFGIPLVIRYVLQTCRTTEEAMRILRRIPVHMSYNVTTLDRPACGPRRTWLLTGQLTSPAWLSPPTTKARWNGRRTPRRSGPLSASSTSRNCSRPAPTFRASWRPACAPRCTPPAFTRASAPFIPPSTGPPRGSLGTTGRTVPGSIRWTGSGPGAPRFSSAGPSRTFPAQT